MLPLLCNLQGRCEAYIFKSMRNIWNLKNLYKKMLILLSGDAVIIPLLVLDCI